MLFFFRLATSLSEATFQCVFAGRISALKSVGVISAFSPAEQR